VPVLGVRGNLPTYLITRLQTPAGRPGLPVGKAVFAVFSLLAMSGAVLSALEENDPGRIDPASRNPMMQAVLAFIYVITVSLLLPQWKQAMKLLFGDRLLVTLLVIILLSGLWSAFPEITLRRAIALLGTTTFGLYLALNFDWDAQLRLLAWVAGVAACLSVLCVLTFPSLALTANLYSTDWRGIYGHKNALGQMMCLGAVVFLVLWRHQHRTSCKVGFPLCVALLWLSGSMTALWSAVVLVLTSLMFKAARWRKTGPVPAFLILLVAVAWAVLIFSSWKQLLDLSGRDTTLTGRTDLWSHLYGQLLARPWLGYGFGAYWLGWQGASAATWGVFEWQPLSAHNGFIDIALSVGLMGSAVFVAGFGRSCLRAINLARHDPSGRACTAPIYLLGLTVLLNLGETVLLLPNCVFWALYTSTTVTLALQTRRKHRL
jgi:exopolysaccharide production protein ExoQ